MALILNGTDGLSDVDGSASTPAIRGTDTNTGIFFPAADTIAFAEGGTEVMRLDSSGRSIVQNGPVGAGNTSSVKGVQTYFDATNNIGYIYSTQAGVANYRLSLNGNDIDFNQGAMRINSSGNLLLGTTSNIGGFGGFRFHVAGSNAGIAVRATTNADWGVSFYNQSDSNVGNIVINSSSTAYNTTSDYRLKENIAPMTGALAVVGQLKPCTYTWKSNGSSGQGFIAHELQAIVPDCVTGEKDAVETYIDEDGVEQTRPKYQGIDTSFLVATLTAAIQEQQAIITDLKSRIEALEAK
jgi:hypothetical protein